jgi:hypothetical protein
LWFFSIFPFVDPNELLVDAFLKHQIYHPNHIALTTVRTKKRTLSTNQKENSHATTRMEKQNMHDFLFWISFTCDCFGLTHHRAWYGTNINEIHCCTSL